MKQWALLAAKFAKQAGARTVFSTGWLTSQLTPEEANMFIDQQEINYRRDHPQQDLDAIVGMECCYYHLVSEKSKDPERKNGICGTPAIVVGVRGKSGEPSFFVDLAFATDVPDIFLVLENLEVSALEIEPLVDSEREAAQELHFVDYKNREEIISVSNEAKNPRRHSDYEKFRGKLFPPKE
jgi:hypothetical protein